MKKTIFIFLLSISLVFIPGFYTSSAENKLEIYNCFTDEKEKIALETTITLFNEKYPEIKVINATITGEAGANAKTLLKTRMMGGNPPDTFQVRGGAELIENYVKKDMMESITDLVNEMGVRNKIHPDILDMCSYEGEIYSIPINIHRGNVLWYNKSLLKRYDIQPPSTIAELLSAMEELNINGVTPLVLGNKNKWPATHIFETVMVAELGVIGYNNIWNSSTNFNQTALKNTLTTFKNILYYINEDHNTLTWEDACQRLYEGKAAFMVMGDWAEGHFKEMNWTPGEQFGWIPMPGTNGSFMVITDTFGLPKKAANPDAAKQWLKFITSTEIQDAFNLINGSISCRIDTNKDIYDPYLYSSINDFTETNLTPSIVHGSAAPQDFVLLLNDIVSEFITEKDIDKALNDIIKIADDYL